MEGLFKTIRKDNQETTEEQQREQDIKALQDYSKFVPAEHLDTPEKLAEWLNDDDWE